MKAVFIDIETSGLDPQVHVPLEIALCIVDMHTMECIDSFHTFVCMLEKWQFDEFSCPIALEVNGIKWEDIKDAPHETLVSLHIIEFLEKHGIFKNRSFFLAQNPTLDRIFFLKVVHHVSQEIHNLPYHWLDLASMYWMKVLVPLMSHSPFKWAPLSKDSIAQELGIPYESKPHRAMNGVNHLLECYKALRVL